MKLLVLLLFGVSACPLFAQETIQKEATKKKTEPSLVTKPKKTYHRPATISVQELKEYEGLHPDTQAIIKEALALSKDHGWLHYKFGSADPKNGGLDCSGSMYYLLRNHSPPPPRTSAQQFLWIRENGTLVAVTPEVESLEDPIFKKLRPGDLLFWGGTYVPTDGRKVDVTHVSMYLGTEKKDGLRVMAGASKGRSYRRIRRDGFGVYEFKLPSKRSKSKFVGFGRIPGLKEQNLPLKEAPISLPSCH